MDSLIYTDFELLRTFGQSKVKETCHLISWLKKYNKYKPY